MKALIIHHDDPDGRMGGYILYRFLLNQYPEVKTKEANYNTIFDFKELVEPEDKVFIVDFSLNNQYFTKLTDIVPRENIVWIDHHKSAIESYTNQATLEGIRNVSKSGCELAYIYTKGYREKSPGRMVNINSSNEVEFKLIEDIEIPRPIQLIGDYDVWRHNGEGIEYFFIDGLDAYWDRAKLTTPEGLNFWKGIYENTDNVIDDIIDQGKIINRYKVSMNACDVEDKAFPCRLRKFENIECIAINSCARSSTIFKSVHNDYEVGLVFNYIEIPERKMEFSIYRLGKNKDKDIDVSKIAQSFGGGGHHDASGFATNGTLPFVSK